MTSEKTVKAVISVLLLTFIDIVLTYSLQCIILATISDRSQIQTNIAFIVLAGFPAVLAQIVFAVMSKKTELFDTKDTCLIITSNMILYILIMLLVFEHIPIAFSLIPDAEMGLGFLQLLIKIFACAAAGICAVVSLVVLAINRSQNTY
ncbi:MAG: hypothetical protein IKR23_07560 [Lachnospiraceae bacterium]|nr:hypothetical protein [Lachnospiraceae bacterium]